MYRTKKDVDRHVQDINTKVKSAQERNLKGYFIAKLYYQVGDYESARKYITGYLAEKDSHVIAHKLNGQILASLKQTEKALSAYKTCYQLDTSQKDVLETICQLLLELPIDPGRTKYWIEQAESLLPHSDVLFRLKEALVSKTDGETSAEFESMLNKELAAKPQDVNLRIRLIKYYQRVGRIKDGYENAIKEEEKRPWPTSLAWYRTLVEIFENYQVAYKGNLGKDYYGGFLSVLDVLLHLEIVEGTQYSRIAEYVSKMDKLLCEALQSQVPPEKKILEHFQAQFYLHSARLIYRKLTKDIHPGSIKEHHRTLGSALLAAYTSKPAQEVNNSRWSHLKKAEEIRRSISGHCLLSLADRFGGLENYRERLASVNGINSKISSLIFVSLERRISSESSFLSSTQFPIDIATAEFPNKEILRDLDSAAAQNSIGDLNTLVWILLRYYSPGKVLDIEFPLPSVEGLPEVPTGPYFSVSQLDAHCFLYAAAYTAGYRSEEIEEDFIVPPYLAANMTTSDQDSWWRLVLTSVKGNLAPLDKRTLQYGLDAIRCKGLHGLDVQLTLKLGKTYECHALEASATADSDAHANSMVTVYESRAASYYKAALASIEKLEQGIGLREPILRLFPAGGADPTKAELVKMRESALFFLACENMHNGLHEEALNKFKEVKSAYASFYSAEIFKKLAQQEILDNPTHIGVSQTYINYLTDARGALYLTLDRLKNEPPGHAVNSSIGDAVQEIENLLHEAEGGEVLQNGGGESHPTADISARLTEQLSSTPRSRTLQQGRADQFAGTVGLHTQPTTPNRSLFMRDEREAKPSPERLDAQIRQISYNQEGFLKSKEILTILKDVKTELQEVRGIKEELQDLRKELKESNVKTLELLQKIADKPAPAATPSEPSYSLSEEEKLLLESFGIGTGPSVATSAALSPLVNLQQQQQQLYMAMVGAQQRMPPPPAPAAVRPVMPATAAAAMYNQQVMAGLYQSPLSMYGVQLPTVPAAPAAQPAVDITVPPVNVPPPQVLPPAEISQAPPVSLPAAISQTSVIVTPPANRNRPVESEPPSNVVISKSDKIPTVAPPMVSMSVTVPPQHRFGVSPQVSVLTPKQGMPSTPQSAYKTPESTPGTPHSFQIALPGGSKAVPVSPFSQAESPAVPITTQSILSSIPTPVYSAVTPSPEKGVSTPASRTRLSSGGTPKARLPSAGEEPEEYEPEVDFKPVVPLPEEVEVVTGEEEEEILFEDRAKLFRYATETKEWKERGLGQAKILKHKETGKIRFLMRRDQTFKICANHNILPEMKLEKMKDNNKTRIWGAQDFADGEAKTEKFCIRMKTEEQIEKFQLVFESAVRMSAETKTPKKAEKEAVAPIKSLADFAAAQKASSWECQGCLTRNDNAKIQCLACESAKPGHEEEVKKLKDAVKPAAAVMTIGAGGGFKFGSGSATTSSSGFSFGSPAVSTGSSEQAKPSGGFTFGTPATATPASSTSALGTPKPSVISFGTPKSTTATTEISFGTPKATTITFGGTPSAATTATPASSSTTLGGFSFSTTPTVTKIEAKPKAEEKVKEEAPKPSPFSNFSFGSVTGSKVEVVKPDSSKAEPEKPAIFGSNVSFQSVSAAGGASEAFKVDPNFKGFSTAGSKLFSNQKEEKEEEGGADEEYEPDVDFKPVIPLPELVEVKTGEEEEDVLFSERSKLFRYVGESKEWKERGIGDFKILKNPTTKRVRFLMRREQVLKLCCNHNLSADLDIKQMSTSDRAWTWTAADFSEGEIKNEVFGLKFKTPELAASFKKVVDKCQADLKDSPPEDKSAEKPKEPEKKEDTKPVSLADFAAAQKASSWECQGCLTRNDNAKIQCLACESAKPGHEEEVKKLKEAAKPVISFGAGGGFKFGSGTTSTTETSSTGGFTFGTPSSTATNGFTFGTPKPAAPAPTAEKGETPKPFFGTKEVHEFSFTGVKASPKKQDESTVSETDLYQEEEGEGDNIYFEPVIPLPDKVEVKTGEEEETVLYSHKAKVFRYADNEWKERGIGDIKILRHEKTGKVRLLMRREQVLKICLNHYVTPQLVSTFKEKDTKSWTWAAQDFSDGELATMTFALRFKTPDISSEFKTALDDAMAAIGSAPTTETKTTAEVSSKPTKADAKAAAATEKEEILFKVEDFKPRLDVEKENELSFEGLGLKLNNEEDAKDVADKIRAEQNMHILTLAGNTVGIEAAKAIGEALEHRPEFRRAHWKDMFTGRMKTEIPPALINLTRGIMTAQATLVELDLSDNAFGPIGMEGLTTFLKSPSCFTLQELRLNNTGCGVTGGKLLAATLMEAHRRSTAANHPLSLKVFVLGRSRQENEGATALAEVFKAMGSLEEVVMPQNGICYQGLTALADAFSNNPNLRILNLNDNTFTEKGAKAMAKTLKKLNNLEVLNVGDCLLKSAGAQLISRALKGRHPNLRELIMDSNEIRTVATTDIVEAVKGKEQLKNFSIDGNWFGESGEKTLKKNLEDIGKLNILGSMEDNEEPDEDEPDPKVEDEDEEDAEPKQEDANKPSKTLGSIFSGSPSSSGSLFGGTSSAAKNLFGDSSKSAAPNGLFGTPTSEAKTSLFGGSSVFGNSTTATPTSGSIFGGAVSNSGGGSTLFGKPAASSAFSFSAAATSAPASSLFGGSSSSTEKPGLFTSAAKDDDNKTVSAEPDSSTIAAGSVFASSASSSFSFASLAKDSQNTGFGFGTKSEGFTFQGTGSQLFSKANNNTSRTEKEDGDEEEEVTNDHDPHFEPIVPLPELIDVKTGEEEEEVVFQHRAKVYRYTTETKEWKERGVGDIKILKHPVRSTYRVLLRRDQVHKIACNHLITAEMQLQPLASSETAWCWYAMDYSEGNEDGRVDQLAVRFKTKDTADDFKAKFESCQAAIAARKSKSPGAEADSTGAAEEKSTTRKTVDTWKSDKEEEDEEDGEYDEDDYADYSSPMFEAQCRLAIKEENGNFGRAEEVIFRIEYDDDMFGARIFARHPDADENEPNLCDHLIAIQTQLEDDLSWSALDYSQGDNPIRRTFRIELDSEEMTNDFKDVFSQGKEFAEECEIMENAGEVDLSHLVYGVGGD